jgi:hypothetical protein
MWVDYLFPQNFGDAQPATGILGPAQAGLTAYCNGVSWNPIGDGVARWVMWTGTAWTKILISSDTISTPFSSQNVVTGSRAIGTVYHNTTGKTMFVLATVTAGTGATLAAITDSNSAPTTVVGEEVVNSGFPASIGFMVLSNNYYKITAAGDTLTYWVEWY